MKTVKPEVTPIKLEFNAMSSFEFASMIQKLASSPTSNKNACAIARVVRELEKAQKLISDTYQTEVVEVFGKKGEDGKVIRPEDDPNGYEPLEMEGYDEKLAAALEVFGKHEFEVNSKPLTPSILADIKISAKEINLLKGLFTEDEAQQNAGPGVPPLQSM